ncbi:flagellar hook-associated protein FlgK [Anaerosporobacter sp.]
MGNIMTSLWTAVSGFTVSQNAINTTAHNLVNVDTEGAVRQQVIIQDFHYNKIGQSAYSSMQTGLGAATQVVRQVRDEFYDNQYRTESGRLSYYDAQKQTILEVEDIMGELESSPFQESIQKLWNNIQELVKSPDDKVARASLAKNAEAFIQRAETIYSQLEEYQVNMNQQITDQVSEINDLGKKIAQLNEQISRIESGGLERANDLRDKRNLYIDQLSKLIDVKATEEYDGTVTIMAENVQLVTGTTSYTMSTVRVEDGTDMVKPVWDHIQIDVFNMSKEPSYESGTNIGSLKSLIWARGNSSANYTDIPQKEDYANNADYQAAIDKYNLEVESSTIRTIQSQLDTLIHGIVTSVNDILCPNVEITQADGSTIKVLSPDAPMGMDDNKTQGTELFSRKSTSRYDYDNPIYVKAQQDANGDTVYVVCDENDPDAIKTYAYNEEDPNDKYSLYTLGEIEINKEVLADYSKIPLSESGGTGDYAYNGVAKALSEIWNQPFTALNPNVLKVNTFNEYYTAIWGDLATKGEMYNSSSENQQTMVNNIATARQNIMGISSDEELSNLIKYQHAYNASARYFNVIDSMLEHLVTRL